MAGKENFIYRKVYNDLLEQIHGGAIRLGERLPTEMELQEHYGVSRDTVRKALAQLETDGYIIRRAAIGTFVRERKADYHLSHHEGFTEQMRKIGKKPSSEILSIELLGQYSQEIAQRLELKEGERLYKISRIRKADGEPMCFETAYVPVELCPNLHTRIYEDTSIYDVYEHYYGLKMAHIDLSIEAESASPTTQKVLGLKPGAPILKQNSTMYLEDGRPLYFVQAYYISGKYIFSATIPRHG